MPMRVLKKLHLRLNAYDYMVAATGDIYRSMRSVTQKSRGYTLIKLFWNTYLTAMRDQGKTTLWKASRYWSDIVY